MGWEEDKRVLINNLLLHSDNPRIINYKLFDYPVQDPVQMEVKDVIGNKDLKLKCYGWPAYFKMDCLDEPKFGETGSKGVVFYSHGWSDYSGR